jgi:hypothetical protein
MRGGDTINQNGLLRFYLMHVFALPAITLVLISVHYYRVARTHGISVPAGEEESPDPAVRKAAKERIDYLPEIFTRELLWVAIITFLVVVYGAFVFHAPLEHHSDPLRTPLHTTAPWYFLWIQGLLKDAFLLPVIRFTDTVINTLLRADPKNPAVCLVCNYDSPAVMGIIMPTIAFAIIFGIPYINEYWEKFWGSKPSRQLLKHRKGAVATIVIGTALHLVLWYQGTPFFGVVAPPSIEIGQRFMPEEGVLPPVPLIPEDYGPVRKLGYEGLPNGTYDLAQYATPPNKANRFERMLSEIEQKVDEQRRIGAESNKTRGLPDVRASFIVQQWQPNMKKITLHLEWTPVNKSDQGTFDRNIYLHRDSIYE